jgi:hypothetical protein
MEEEEEEGENEGGRIWKGGVVVTEIQSVVVQS